MINTLWDWDNWFGYDAKWLDTCEMSPIANIDFYTYDFDSADYSKNLIGDQTDSEKCTPGFLWSSSPFGESLGQLQDNMWHYFYNRSHY